MSGHSKWSQIKHKKAITDAKKGKAFSKMARQISVAARLKGGDPEINYNLRMLIDKARSANMPADNVERAIKKGTGEIEGAKIEEFTLEAFGPGNSALVIEGTTDNRNRTVSEIKHLLSQHNGKFATSGSVLWLFDHCGTINVSVSSQKEELELTVIDSGAQDYKWIDGENFEVYTKPEELEKVKKALEDKKIKITDASLGWKPKNETEIADEKEKDKFEELLDALDESEDVNEIYSNVNY
jgi:YebC/PmpR family DNA-binding regulatory protein